MSSNPKISIIGAGNVGASAAYRALELDFCDVVLLDIIEGLPQGKALDMTQMLSVTGVSSQVIGTNSYEDTKDSDVVMTDKIISLNDKVNKKKKLKSFKNFKVDKKTINLAKKDAIFLHCLPRGNEVTEEVFLGKQSKVWQQALNRVYVQKSILLYCFGKLR